MKKSVFFSVHFLFWLLVYGVFLAVISQFNRLHSTGLNVHLHSFLMMGFGIVPVYTGYFAIPFFIRKKFKTGSLISALLFIITFSVLAVILDDGFAGLVPENILTLLIFTSAAVFAGTGLKSIIWFAGTEHQTRHNLILKV